MQEKIIYRDKRVKVPDNFTSYYFPKAPIIKQDIEALIYTKELREALRNSNENLENIKKLYGENNATEN